MKMVLHLWDLNIETTTAKRFSHKKNRHVCKIILKSSFRLCFALYAAPFWNVILFMNLFSLLILKLVKTLMKPQRDYLCKPLQCCWKG